VGLKVKADGARKKQSARIPCAQTGYPEIPLALERLAADGFKPARVFDVGAYWGDFATLCLRIWPACQVTCFEPLPHKVKELTELARQAAIRVVPGLLGAQAHQRVRIH